jgi:hypothetical protein
MIRVLLLARRPLSLSPHDARAWLEAEARHVLTDPGVDEVCITTLGTASSAWCRSWDYLVAIVVAAGSAPDAVVGGRGCSGLLAEMRLMGMSPNVFAADDAKTAVLSGTRS